MSDPPDRTHAVLTPEAAQHRNAQIVDLKHDGRTFQEIGNTLGLSKQRVHELYWQAMHEVIAPGVNALRAQQNAELEAVKDKMQAILNRDHYAMSGGTIVRGPAELDQFGQPLTLGEPLHDDGPKIQAAGVISRLIEQQAKLNGTFAPVTATINGTIHYEVAGVDLKALQ